MVPVYRTPSTTRGVFSIFVGSSGLIDGVVDPLHLKILDVVAIDLRERTVTVTRITSRIREPVLRLPIRVKQAVVGHLRLQGTGQQRKYRNSWRFIFLPMNTRESWLFAAA